MSGTRSAEPIGREDRSVDDLTMAAPIGQYASVVKPGIGVGRRWLDEAPMSTKRAVVGQLVAVLRPFGALAEDIIGSARFDELATVVLASLMNDDQEGIESALAELETTPSLSRDEEPEEPGFFALGAVVELVYAARLARGDERSASPALARADDVLGAADDELGTDARAELLQWVAHCAIAGTAVEGSGALAVLAAAQAERLQSHPRRLARHIRHYERMGLFCDYFVASTESEAASTIDWIGGPSKPPAPRGLLRRSNLTQGFRTVSLPGIEPTMWMGKLEEVLTGRTFDEILADTSGKMVASRDGGERLVLSLTANLQDALVGFDDQRIEQVAGVWSTPDEYYGTGGDPELAAEALRALISMLRAGRHEGMRAFCWVCV